MVELDNSYLVWREKSFSGDKKKGDGDEDVRVTLGAGDNIPLYFIQGLRDARAGGASPPMGFCPGMEVPSC